MGVPYMPVPLQTGQTTVFWPRQEAQRTSVLPTRRFPVPKHRGQLQTFAPRHSPQERVVSPSVSRLTVTKFET